MRRSEGRRRTSFLGIWCAAMLAMVSHFLMCFQVVTQAADQGVTYLGSKVKEKGLLRPAGCCRRGARRNTGYSASSAVPAKALFLPLTF